MHFARHLRKIVIIKQNSSRLVWGYNIFLSCEPLIGPIYNINLSNIDWMIVGGESGHKARPMEEEWVLDLLDQCKQAGVKFFFKQWGGKNKKKTGRLLLDKTWDDMPY